MTVKLDVVLMVCQTTARRYMALVHDNSTMIWTNDNLLALLEIASR